MLRSSIKATETKTESSNGRCNNNKRNSLSSEPEYSSDESDGSLSGSVSGGTQQQQQQQSISAGTSMEQCSSSPSSTVGNAGTVHEELERLRQYRKCFDEKLCSLKQSVNELLTGIESLRLMNEQLYRNGVFRLKSFKKKKRSKASLTATAATTTTTTTTTTTSVPSAGTIVHCQQQSLSGVNASSTGTGIQPMGNKGSKIGDCEESKVNNNHKQKSTTLSTEVSAPASATVLSTSPSGTFVLATDTAPLPPPLPETPPPSFNEEDRLSAQSVPLLLSLSCSPSGNDHCLEKSAPNNFKQTIPAAGDGRFLSFLDDYQAKFSDDFRPVACPTPPVHSEVILDCSPISDAQQPMSMLKNKSIIATSSPPLSPSPQSASVKTTTKTTGVTATQNAFQPKSMPQEKVQNREYSLKLFPARKMSAPVEQITLKDHRDVDDLSEKEIDSFIDSLYEGARMFFEFTDQQILEHFEELHLNPLFLFNQTFLLKDTSCDEEEDAEDDVEQDASDNDDDFEMIENEPDTDEHDNQKAETEVDEITEEKSLYRLSTLRLNHPKDVLDDSGAASDSSKDSFSLTEASDEEYSIVCRQDSIGDKSRAASSPDSTLCSSPDDYPGQKSCPNSRPDSCSLPSISESPTSSLKSVSPSHRRSLLKPAVSEPVADFQRIRLRPVRRSATFNEPSRSAPLHLDSQIVSADETIPPGNVSETKPGLEMNDQEKMSFHKCRNLWERRSLSKEYKYKPLENVKKSTLEEVII